MRVIENAQFDWTREWPIKIEWANEEFQGCKPVIPKLFIPSYNFELLYSVRVPPKLHLTRISQTINYASVDKKNEHVAALKINKCHSRKR